MQYEQINFTYILTASAVTVPISVIATVNETPVSSFKIVRNGRFEFVVETNLKSGLANLVLHVGNTDCATVTVNAIKMQWVKENSNINPAWTSREAGPGEIWNYNMPASAAAWSAETNVAHHGTIVLDYETDNRKSFLRNYATVCTNNQQFDLKDKTGPYTFKTAGTFALQMTSPLSYWLMQRLFVVI